MPNISNALHAALAQIELHVDRWLDDDVVDIDSHRTGGLLELSVAQRQQAHRQHPAAAA
jgi:hypothetical protein